MVHPNASFWAHGAPFGPFLNALTFKSSGASLPIRSWIFASLSRGGISSAMLLRWGCSLAISGVGISFFSCGMPSHSMRVGNFDVLPWMDLMTRPDILRPYLTSLSPPQVER